MRVLIEQARQEAAGKPQALKVEEALGYFARNIKRMQYGTFRSKGYFIGSGVVEAGCKTVIGARCKQRSGMFWSESGAQNILALRCIPQQPQAGRRFWKDRLNGRAAHNDALPVGGLTEEFCLTPVCGDGGGCALTGFYSLRQSALPSPASGDGRRLDSLTRHDGGSLGSIHQFYQ